MCIYKDDSGEEKEIGSAFVYFYYETCIIKNSTIRDFYKKSAYYILKGSEMSVIGS